MTTIEFDPFDSKSCLEAAKKLEQYEEWLEAKCKELVLDMAKQGVEIAKATIQGLPYSTGDLESSIYAIYDDKTHTAMIVADSDHAVFVEFGTGLIGEGTYTNADYLALASKFGWQGYYVGGEKGYEFRTKDGREGWITRMNNGEFYFTEGQTAKHFMDNAVKGIYEKYEETVARVFKN